MEKVKWIVSIFKKVGREKNVDWRISAMKLQSRNFIIKKIVYSWWRMNECLTISWNKDWKVLSLLHAHLLQRLWWIYYYFSYAKLLHQSLFLLSLRWKWKNIWYLSTTSTILFHNEARKNSFSLKIETRLHLFLSIFR